MPVAFEAGGWWASRAALAYKVMREQRVTHPVVLFLVHTPNDVAAQRIPVFTWTGVISTNDRILKQVLEDRSKSIADGGLGANKLQLRRRMEQDQEACREYTSYPIEVLGSLGYSGLPANVYAQMTSLTGESILSIPDSIVPSKSKKGSYDVVLPGEGVSSPTLTLESNQLIPACGGYVVKLGLWQEGLNIPKLLPEFDSFTIGDAVRANAMTDLPYETFLDWKRMEDAER